MAISPVPLAPLFWRLRHEGYDDASRRGISTHAHPTQANVESHPVLLGSILRDRLSNAVKYTDRAGRILIGCRHSGSDLRIAFYDTGISIAPDFRCVDTVPIPSQRGVKGDRIRSP